MDANLNFVTPASSKASPIGAPSGSGGLDPNLAKPMSGQEFAGVMRDLMAKGERQDVAGTATGTAPDAGAAALQTLALGNQFAVITTATPLPDSSSLAQFARAQGLSESAVQALFGDVSASKLGDAPLSAAANASSDPNLGLNLGMMGIGLPFNPLASANISTNPLGSATDASTLTLGPNAQSWAQTGTNGAKVSDLLQMAGATGVIQSMTGLGAPPSMAMGSTDQLAEIAPELGPLDAMRMRMVPAWENMTRQLALMKGTDQAAAWGQLTTNLLSSKALGDKAKEISLDLGADDPDLMATLDAMKDSQGQSGMVNLDSARNTASTGTLGAAATSAALANPGLTDRAAQIQDLADKLGKAMGERLQEQLESGEWKLQLKLNPAQLGKIDVELDMNASGLDAVFKSDNLLTRELITQGMPKLKDSLSQSGMTVANVWVNSENQRGSGGNSTPRQQNGSNQDVQASVKEVSATETRVKDLRSSNAWDTLA
jgi:flagellar hook-length control protein FliK